MSIEAVHEGPRAAIEAVEGPRAVIEAVEGALRDRGARTFDGAYGTWRWQPDPQSMYWLVLAGGHGGHHGELDCILAVAEERDSTIMLRAVATAPLQLARGAPFVWAAGPSPRVLVMIGGVAAFYTTQSVAVLEENNQALVEIQPFVMTLLGETRIYGE